MQPHVKRILFTLGILALAVFFYGTFGRNTLLLSLENDAITLNGPEKSAVSVSYSEIASMELREAFAPGTALEGGVKNRICYGQWQNEEFGVYQLFISEKIDTVIVLQTVRSEVLVFNYESEETTRRYFDSFTAFLADEGYSITALPLG